MGRGVIPTLSPTNSSPPIVEPAEDVAGVQEGMSPHRVHLATSYLARGGKHQCPPQSPTQLFTRVFPEQRTTNLFPSCLSLESPYSVLWGSSSLSLTSIPPTAPTVFFFFFPSSSFIQMPQLFQLLPQLSSPHLSLILPSLTPVLIHFGLLVSRLGRSITHCPSLSLTVPVLILKVLSFREALCPRDRNAPYLEGKILHEAQMGAGFGCK